MNKLKTLCRPANDISCFRCCPPIRPAGYDHLHYRGEVAVMLQKNTKNIQQGRFGEEIEGNSCWGLGYLDDSKRTAGCLLHPKMNADIDLRMYTGYQEKCARETCPQSKIFEAISDEDRLEIIKIVRREKADHDSFVFSSSDTNPVWNLLLWGAEVLQKTKEAWCNPDHRLYDFFLRQSNPRAWAYPVGLAVKQTGLHALEFKHLKAQIDAIKKELILITVSPLANAPFVHRLGIGSDLSDFIRLYLKVPKTEKTQAEEISTRVRKIIKEINQNQSSE